MASSWSNNSPCAACKILRRKCTPGCIFSPHFPPEETEKFVNVQKIFGARNVAKLQRAAAANSLAYEAEARVRDPIHGCIGVISFLQRQVDRLQKELDDANADLIWFACNDMSLQEAQPRPMEAIGGRNVDFGGGGGGGIFYQTGGVPVSYDMTWNDIYISHGGGMDGSI